MERRNTNRLQNYDYSTSGYYFVSVCLQNRLCLLGEIVGAGPCAGPRLELNNIGEMVDSVWRDLPNRYPNIQIDEYAIMPDHFHGIVTLTHKINHGAFGRPRGAAPTLSLPDVMHRFKSLTTARYRRGVKEQGWKRFPGRFWQRGYFDRVIRNETELFETRNYIRQNVLKWTVEESEKIQWIIKK